MAREPMPDVVVILPGICGSVLRKDGRDLWALSGEAALRALLSHGRDLDAMKLTEDDPDVDDLGDGIVADRLIGDVHLIPYLWKIDGYTKVASTIQAAFEVQPERNYFEFAYDWRRDNRASARRLRQESRRWLRDWRASSGNASAKLVLIAHSMGGLVARYFLEILEGWRECRALITFGTPYRGSLNALDFLANGFRKGPSGIVDLSGLVRSLTSVYQLLPSYPCYDSGDGKLVRVGETAGIHNVDPQKAAAALAFHREIARTVEEHRKQDDYMRSGYIVYPIVGIQQPTLQSARLVGDVVQLFSSHQGGDDKGDGTVPRVSATPLELSRERKEMFAATRHAALQNADAVLGHVRGILSGLDLDLGEMVFHAPQGRLVQLGLELDDVYWQDEPLAMRVTPDSQGVKVHARIVSVDTGIEVARLPLATDDEGYCSVEFPPLASGTYRITVAGGADVEAVTDVFTVFDRTG